MKNIKNENIKSVRKIKRQNILYKYKIITFRNKKY